MKRVIVYEVFIYGCIQYLVQYLIFFIYYSLGDGFDYYF